jgi:hypothetical protein
MRFPLNRLPCDLHSLTLCFFALRPHDASHLSNLTVLRITVCSFNGSFLAWTVERLHNHATLVLGSCYLTDGCGPRGLSISSMSLRYLHMWSCTDSGGIQLQYTPRLSLLCTGVLPIEVSILLIDLRTPFAMRSLHVS